MYTTKPRHTSPLWGRVAGGKAMGPVNLVGSVRVSVRMRVCEGGREDEGV